MQDEIVVVTTTDTAYLLYCYVLVHSIIKTAKSDKAYRIFILVAGVSQEECGKLEKLSSGHISVECIDVIGVAKRFDLRETEQFPISIYYRFFIPLILPEYKKVLYLDADMCVLHDIADLYGTELGEAVMGTVNDIPCRHLEEHDKEIGGLDCRKTFNSGVLLMDTEAFEREKIREKCMVLLLEDYKEKERKLIYPDNDALNLVLYQKCKALNGAWNFQVQYMWKTEEIFEEYREGYKKVSRKPFILHYTGKYKPWLAPDRPMADVFWKLAKETAIYDEIVFKLLVEAQREREARDDCRTFRFPYPQVPYGSKIAIYGAGKVGQAFYSLMAFSRYAEVALWVDQKHKDLSADLPVEAPCQLELRREEYQYLIVAIEKEEIADEVIAQLCPEIMSSKKIVWNQYRK